MVIVHILAYFKENVAYQENYLTRGEAELGHEVHIITSKWEYDFGVNSSAREHPLGDSEYNGVLIHRTPIIYDMKKRFVIFKHLYKDLKSLNPDLIFFHDHSPELLTCIRYVKRHPKTKLRVDIHSTIDNSMHSLFGKPYHKIFWRGIIHFAIKYYDKVFCICPESREFAEKIYHIPHDRTEIMILPGDASLLENYDSARKQIRQQMGLDDNDIAVFHTGKLPQEKRTFELIEAYKEAKLPNTKLIIIGYIEEESRDRFDAAIKDDKSIIYMGWMTSDELKRHLIGADLLLQPNAFSNTYIEAMCCAVPLGLCDSEYTRILLSEGNGFTIHEPTVECIRETIKKNINREKIDKYREKAKNSSHKYHYLEIARQSVS